MTTLRSKPIASLVRIIATLLIIAAAVACQSAEPKTRQDRTKTEDPDPEAGKRLVSIFITNPPGATLTIDGTRIGRTPVGAALPDKKEVKVVLELDGYNKTVDLIERDIVGWHDSYTYVLQSK